MTDSSASLRYLHRVVDHLAYAHRPMLWPAIARNVARKLTGKPRDAAEEARQRAEATAWCRAHVAPASEALQTLGFDADLGEPEELFPQIMAAARARADAVPVPMGGPGALGMIYTICERLGAERVVETGVALGWSSLATLLSLRNRRPARLHSVDLPYFERRNDRWVGAAVPDDLKAQWVLYRMADREGLPRALKQAGRLDFAHYDSDKSLEGRLFAYPLLWAALRPGGILMSDDIQDNMGFANLCAREGLTPCVIEKGENLYAGILRKVASAGKCDPGQPS